MLEMLKVILSAVVGGIIFLCGILVLAVIVAVCLSILYILIAGFAAFVMA